MSSERVRACLSEGVSVLIGTVDADGYPACCRGVALTSDDDFGTITVYFPVETGQETVANVATTRRIAVAFSEPISHQSVQFKGTMRAVRVAREDEALLVRERVERFAAVLETIGSSRTLARRITHWPAFALEIQVEQIFDQTPGPRAGEALL